MLIVSTLCTRTATAIANSSNLERYGLNPTFTYAPSAVTKIQLSYEYFHDQRVIF